MIRAEFTLRDEQLAGFSISGHAGYAAYGQDIVCAAVSSAVEFTANGVTEILKVPATVGAFDNEIRLLLPENAPEVAVAFIKALRLHLELLSQDFPGKLKILEAEI